MLSQIQSAEQSVINTLKQATAALDAVGTTELSAALADLERARAAALARLEAAANVARATVGKLADDAGQIAATLQADLFGQQQQVEPAIAAAPSANGAAAADATHQPAEPHNPASTPSTTPAASEAPQVTEPPADAPPPADDDHETVLAELADWRTLRPRGEVVANVAANKPAEAQEVSAGAAGAAGRNGRRHKTRS